MFTRDRVTGWPATGSLLKEAEAVGGCHGRYNPLIIATLAAGNDNDGGSLTLKRLYTWDYNILYY